MLQHGGGHQLTCSSIAALVAICQKFALAITIAVGICLVTAGYILCSIPDLDQFVG